MAFDVRKPNNSLAPTRSVYYNVHFCVRAFHRIISYPGYSLFILFIMYLQIMEIILYFKIRSRGLFDYSSSNTILNQTDNPQITPIFGSLPIKKIMIEPINHFVRTPLAESIEIKFHFTYYFPFISANAVSYFHCFLSLISVKYFSSKLLFHRRIGVLIFQFRTFLDCFDGVIYRSHINNKRFKSYYGNFGYYVDVISDVLGGTCLIIGCLLYLYKQRPFCPSKPLITTRTNKYPSSSASDEGSDETDLTVLNLEDDQASLLIHSQSKKIDTNSTLFETKLTIFVSLALFSLRYIFAAIFWDRNVHAYEDLLDSQVDTLQEKSLQLGILHSPLTILIFYLWRYLCALSIQDYLLLAIFMDRIWEFLQWSSKLGWFTLILTIILTEVHANQIRSLFAALVVT